MKKIEIRKDGNDKNRVIIENDNHSYDVIRFTDSQLKQVEKTIRDIIAANVLTSEVIYADSSKVQFAD